MSNLVTSKTTEKPPAIPPLLGLGGAILAVSTASLFIRLAQHQAPSLVIAAGRLGFAALILAPFAWRSHRAELAGLSRRQWGVLILSGVLLAVHFAAWITSLELTSVASSVVLVTSTPLWVALFAPLVLRERFSRSALAGMLLALAGGVFVALSESCTLGAGGLACNSSGNLLEGKAFLGNFLALVGAWAAAFYLMAGRRMRASLSLVGYTFVVYGTAAMVLLGMVLVSGQSLTGYPPETYLLFLLLALVPQLLGHSSFNWALKYLPTAYVSVALLGEPVGAILLTTLFLGEVPAGLELVGGVLILAGIFWASWKQK